MTTSIRPREPLRRCSSAIGGAVSGLLLSLTATARAREPAPEHELAEAIENTGERIDVVGDKLVELGDAALEMLPLLAVALLTVVLFWLLARLLTGGDWLFRWIDNRFVRDMARHFARIVIVGAGVLLALELLDATALVGAAIGAAGVIGIAVGFAFRDIIENYLAGLLLSVRHPFEPNDLISIDGDEGKVVRLTSRATVLLTLAGNHLRIPNSKVFKAVLLNYSQNPTRRLDFEVGVGVGEDLTHAQRTAVEALAEMPAIIAEPAPLALIEALGDFAVQMHFYAWVDQRDTDYFKAKSEAIRLVKAAFDAAGIEMPEPTYQVYTKTKEESAAERPVRLSAESQEPGDTSADALLDAQVESERAAEGPDLLDEEAPRE